MKLIDTIEKILNEEINYFCDDGFARVDILGTEYAAEKIVNLLTPKLKWFQGVSNSMSCTLLGGSICIFKVKDEMWAVTDNEANYYRCYTQGVEASSLFKGTLNECKEYCNKLVQNEYLKLCH